MQKISCSILLRFVSNNRDNTIHNHPWIINGTNTAELLEHSTLPNYNGVESFLKGHTVIGLLHSNYPRQQCLALSLWQKRNQSIANLINISNSWGIWNTLHHGQSIHPTENCMSLILFKFSSIGLLKKVFEKSFWKKFLKKVFEKSFWKRFLKKVVPWL